MKEEIAWNRNHPKLNEEAASIAATTRKPPKATISDVQTASRVIGDQDDAEPNITDSEVQKSRDRNHNDLLGN